MLKKSYAMEEDWLCSNLFLQVDPWLDEAVIHPPSELHHRHLLCHVQRKENSDSEKIYMVILLYTLRIFIA